MLIADKINAFFGSRQVLSDVSFELADGEIMVLLGPNGAGKTTLIKTLNGTLRSSGGNVSVKGSGDKEPRDIRILSRREVARRIAVVAQETETRFPVTVKEFVLSGRFVHGGSFGWDTEKDRLAADNALAECELNGYENRLMNELSGGERQRVVLARALAVNADIYLLDEPTANLDIAHQTMMFRSVKNLCRSTNASAVVITHDLNLAAAFTDKILLLKNGSIAAYGRPEKVLTAANIEYVFGVNVLLDTNPASGHVRVTNVF